MGFCEKRPNGFLNTVFTKTTHQHPSLSLFRNIPITPLFLSPFVFPLTIQIVTTRLRRHSERHNCSNDGKDTNEKENVWIVILVDVVGRRRLHILIDRHWSKIKIKMKM